MNVRILRFCAHRLLRRIGQYEQNWLSCAKVTKRHRNCKILQISFRCILLLVLIDGCHSQRKDFSVKLIKIKNKTKIKQHQNFFKHRNAHSTKLQTK